MEHIPEVVPVFGSDAVALAMATSDQYVPYLYTSLLSILENSTREHQYDIIVLVSGVSAQNRRILEQLAGGYEGVCLRFVDVEEIIKSYSLFVRDWFHPIIYARLLLPDLMRRYEKVLYMDSDTIAQTDVAELYEENLDGKIMGAVQDIAQIAMYSQPGSDIRFDLDCRLKLKRPLEYINTGVILFHVEEFRKVFTAPYLLEYASSREWKWQDQDIFMTLCEGKIKLLSPAWNVLVHGPIRDENDLMEKTAPQELYAAYLQAREQPKLIHYVANSFLLVSPLPDLFPYFWQYARRTPYYEEILFRVFQKNFLRTDLQSVWDNFNRLEHKVDEGGPRQAEEPAQRKPWNGFLKNKVLKPIANVFFPEGTDRRYRLRRLYHKMRGDV